MNPKSIAAWPVLFLLMVACGKDPAPVPAPTPTPVTPSDPEEPSDTLKTRAVSVNAVFETFTKSTLEDSCPIWTAGDNISLFGSEGNNSVLKMVSSDGVSATFSGDADAKGPWVAVFPYKAENACVDGFVTVSVPSSQLIPASGNVGEDALICVGSCDDLGRTISLKNVTSLVNFTVAIDQADMTSVTIRTSDGSPLTGTVMVDPSTGEVAEVLDGCDHVTLTKAEGHFVGGECYASVIPGRYSGLVVTCTRSSDARKAELSSEDFVGARGGMTSLGNFDLSTLKWHYFIDSYEDLVSYAGDTDNWEEAEDVELRTDIDMESRPWTPLTCTKAGGTFKGNGHKIYNLIVNPPSSIQHCGFFGKYYKSVENIVFGSKDGKTWDGVSTITCNYSGDSSNWAYAAPLTFPKKNVLGIVNFCKVIIPETCGSKSRCGGICAFVEQDDITIRDCVNYGTIETFTTTQGDKQTCAGGIAGGIGSNSGTTIENCENSGDVISHNKYSYGIGGILGMKYSDSSRTSILNCVNRGNVKHLSDGNTQNSLFSIGGIAGQFGMTAGKTDCRVEGCINYGDIYSDALTSIQTVGGIVGRMFGGSVKDCVNEGKVETEFEVAVSYVGIGGIVGFIHDKYADNYVTGCTNRGKIGGLTLSIGYSSKSSSADFLGTCAGGIIGTCEEAAEISGNSNYGSVDFGTKREGKSTYDALAYAGGILGLATGVTKLFTDNHNYPGASVHAYSTSTKSGTYEDIASGGVVGKLMASTISVGINEADVSAVKAAGGTAWAGSIAGINNSRIALCYYDGTVNGVKADKGNVVGYGKDADVAVPMKAVYDYGGDIDDLDSRKGEWD